MIVVMHHRPMMDPGRPGGLTGRPGLRRDSPADVRLTGVAAAGTVTVIWKPQKVYNDGIYLVYMGPTYDDSILVQYIPGIYLVYTCHGHMTMYVTDDDRYIPGIYPGHLSYT